MANSTFALWYCDNISNGIWAYFLLAAPLAGAYLYGQGKKKIAWILILGWAAIHLSNQGLSLFMFNCNAPLD
jgi:hypothetical protein